MRFALTIPSVLASLSYLAATMPGPVSAQEGICASVRVEIHQEFTLERQGFEATLRLTNELPDTPITGVHISVTFQDDQGIPVTATTDPYADGAIFFHRLQEHDGISAVDGSGQIAPDSQAELRWLIVPSAEAAGNSPNGKPYLIGAEVRYQVAGSENTIPVAADFIQVKPLPRLQLDYFIPEQVFADDPFTAEIVETPEPFELGLRVANTGLVPAYSLRVESAQPRIVENRQGLLIDFQLQGAHVGDAPVNAGLSLDLGDVPAQGAVTAAWLMVASLSGRFEDFSADVRHAEELGGQVTSLIESPRTHKLIRRVRVDLPGRDNLSDFLSRDDVGNFRVYESDGSDTGVTDVSHGSSLTVFPDFPLRQIATLPVMGGLVYAQLPDGHAGHKGLIGVTRADGKALSLRNAWLSKTQDRDGQRIEHFVNLFDNNATTSPTIEYTLLFANPVATQAAPQIDLPASVDAVDGVALSFVVAASVADGAVPTLAMENGPVQAGFSDSGDGTGVFDWNIPLGSVGDYRTTFSATSGELRSEAHTLIRVRRPGDADADFIDDRWEMEHFGTLERDGGGDWDGDGIIDRDEYLNGTDPTLTDDPWSWIAVGRITVGGEPARVQTRRPAGAASVIVLLGAPGDLFADPAVPVVASVADTEIGIGLRPWDYLDAPPATQSIDYLVVPEGRYTLPDGTVWEAGTIDLRGDRQWQSHDFRIDFPATPQVFLSVQDDGASTAVARTRDVGPSGFEASLLVEEGRRGAATPNKRIHYLATWSPAPGAVWYPATITPDSTPPPSTWRWEKPTPTGTSS